MTDLPTLLHDRADRAHLAPVDLDAVVRAGDRRVRRRRLATYGAALAVAGVVGGTALLGGGDDGARRAVDPAAPTTRADAAGASWYLDGRLHHDGTSTDLGIDVVTYVRTASGFVLVDTDDVVWSWTGSGRPERVGVADEGSPRLAGDDDGDLVAWIDATAPDRGLLVLDQASGLTTELKGVGAGEAAVTAVDGDRVWWHEGSRSLTWSVAGGGEPQRLPDDTTVLAAQGQRIVFQVEGPDTEIRTRVGDGGADTVLDDQYRDVGALSPDGALWSTDGEQVRVVRTSDGDPVPVDLDAPFSTGFAWSDADSLVVLAGEGDLDDGGSMTARILVCDVPDGGCTDASGNLGTFDDLEAGDFALPVGVEIG